MLGDPELRPAAWPWKRGQKQSKEGWLGGKWGWVRQSKRPSGKGWLGFGWLSHHCPFPPPVVPNRAFIFSLSSSEMRTQASESVSWRICGKGPRRGELVGRPLPPAGNRAGLLYGEWERRGSHECGTGVVCVTRSRLQRTLSSLLSSTTSAALPRPLFPHPHAGVWI